LYRDDPDPGVHGAAEWLLRQWGQSGKLQSIDKDELAMLPVPTLGLGKNERISKKNERRWYINSQGHTMVINLVKDPVELGMGDGINRSRHQVRIENSFAIAAKEVTVEQFQRYWKECHGVEAKYSSFFAPARTCPMNSLTWYDAAGYCNWLSKR